jgi:hypothetical protein
MGLELNYWVLDLTLRQLSYRKTALLIWFWVGLHCQYPDPCWHNNVMQSLYLKHFPRQLSKHTV